MVIPQTLEGSRASARSSSPPRGSSPQPIKWIDCSESLQKLTQEEMESLLSTLHKYNSRIQDGIRLGLDISFNNLCREIESLDNPQIYCSNIDDISQGLLQFEEIGYDVTKLRDRLEVLQTLAQCHQQAVDKAEQLEENVATMRNCISELEDEICSYEKLIVNCNHAIDKLRKNSREAAEKFALIGAASL